VDQQFESVVAVLVHLDEHFEATPAALGSCEYLFTGELALLLSLVTVNFEIACGDAILVEGLVG
jgi:hypothetical protein